MELIGPMNIMNRLKSEASHLRGFRKYSASIRSKGMVVCDTSYNKFWISRWMGNIGRKGKKALAAITLNMFPKLELAVILMYLVMFPNVFRPSSTPSSNTIRSFSSKMMSALSLAISTAESTEIPMSD